MCFSSGQRHQEARRPAGRCRQPRGRRIARDARLAQRLLRIARRNTRPPDMRKMALECGNADEPSGTGMPAWPDGQQRVYTRQHWTEDGVLNVDPTTSWCRPGMKCEACASSSNRAERCRLTAPLRPARPSSAWGRFSRPAARRLRRRRAQGEQRPQAGLQLRHVDGLEPVVVEAGRARGADDVGGVVR